MKRAIQLFSVILFITVIAATPVLAASNQGFEWGFEAGDKFNYTFQMHNYTGNSVLIDEKIYLSITTLPTIPDDMTSWNDIPVVNMAAKWANGTDMGFIVLIFIAAERIAVPIGNYTLLTEFINAKANYDVIDDSLFWGFEHDLALSNGLKMTIHVDFLKSDGMLAHYTVTNFNGTTKYSDVTVIREGLPAGGDIVGLLKDNALYIGAAIVVIGAVYCFARRK